MTTRNSGSRRSSPATTHVPGEPPPHDAADRSLRVPDEPVQAQVAKPPSSNLLLPRTPLIGRAHEVATAQRLLLQNEVGLLTLTGPGGIGKTRVAMQVAANLLDHFVDGVYVVSLAPLTDPVLVIPAIAQTLAVREAGTQTLVESLQDFLRNRQLLLVLDNFEQVVGATPWVAALLAHRPPLYLDELRSPPSRYNQFYDIESYLFHSAQVVAQETMLEYAVDTYGYEQLPTLLAGLAHYDDWETLLPAVYGVSSAKFEQGWQTYMAKEYGVQLNLPHP